MMDQAVRTFEAGEVIFREGERGDTMYVLLEGAVELKKRVEGGEAVLKVVDTPNDFFGEMTLLDDRPRSATAVAARRSRLLAVDRPSFESMILQNGKFALKIIKVLVERIRRSNEQVSELIETQPKERFCRGVADYARRTGERIHDGSYKIPVAGLVEWINGHLGVPRDEIDAALSRLARGQTLSFSKTKEHLIVPEAFVRSHDRREPEERRP